MHALCGAVQHFEQDVARVGENVVVAQVPEVFDLFDDDANVIDRQRLVVLIVVGFFAEGSAWWSWRSGGDLLLDTEMLLDCAHALRQTLLRALDDFDVETLIKALEFPSQLNACVFNLFAELLDPPDELRFEGGQLTLRDPLLFGEPVFLDEIQAVDDVPCVLIHVISKQP